MNVKSDIDLAGFQSWLEKTTFRLSPNKRADFYEMLASLVRDGKPIDESIRELHSRYSKKKRPHATMLADWMRAKLNGASFADAIKEYVDETEVVIIAATDRSGDIASGLQQAALLARAKAAVMSELKKQMAGPIVRLAALFLMLIGFSVEIAPVLRGSLPEWALSQSQRTLFEVSDWLRKWWPAVVALTLGAASAAAYSLPRYTGGMRDILDRIPPWSIYKSSVSSGFMISLSCLIRAGVPISGAIQYVRERSSPYLRTHLNLMASRLRRGMEQGDALDTGLLSDHLSDMVTIYSKTSDFDKAVGSIGRLAVEDGITQVRSKASKANTISMVLIGAALAWIVTAIYGLGDATNRAMRDQPPAVQSNR